MSEILAHWPAFALAAYLGAGFWHALREVCACLRDQRGRDDRAPLWPVWIVVTLLWPMLAAQRFVFWLIVLWDAAAAIRAGKRESDHG